MTVLRFSRMALLAGCLAAGPVAAQERATGSELQLLAAAFDLLAAGEHDAAVEAYNGLANSRSLSPGARRGAAEGEALALVARFRAKAQSAKDNLVEQRLLRADRRTVQAIIEGHLATHDSTTLRYLALVIAQDGPLTVEGLKDHPYAVELAARDPAQPAETQGEDGDRGAAAVASVPAAPAPAPAPAPAADPRGRCVVATTTVNVRSGPGQWNEPVGWIESDEQVIALGEAPDAGGAIWLRFLAPDGFAHSAYFKDVPPAMIAAQGKCLTEADLQAE